MKNRKELMKELEMSRQHTRRRDLVRSDLMDDQMNEKEFQRQLKDRRRRPHRAEPEYQPEYQQEAGRYDKPSKKKGKKKKGGAIENAKVKKKKGAFYYALPHNLVREIHLMGYPFKMKTVFFIYLITILIGCIFGYFFKLGSPLEGNLGWYIALVVSGMLIAPVLIRNTYLNKYELKRFSDVNIYVEQMLYSFRDTQKIFTSLQDISVLFPKGAMRSAIDEAIEFIATRTDKVDVEAEALSLIEKRYPNEQIRSTHRFIQKVEELGGENETSIEILLLQRKNWEQRVYRFIDLKKKQKIQIVGSIIATLLLSMSMLYILPQEVDISANILVKAANTGLIIASMLLYQKTDSKLSTSLIEPKKTKTDKQIVAAYYRVLNYTPVSAIITGLKASVFAIVPFVINALFFKNAIASGVCAALFALFISFGFIRHRTDMKNTKMEVQKAFPKWLLELALLLQSENVQMAIFKTADSAPAILQPELNKLRDELIEDPSSSAPFLNFFAALELPSVTTTMQMLYSLNVGSGGDADKQIVNIVDRNNAMLDRAEELEAESSMASLYSLFYLPMALGAVVLIADMTTFLFAYMGNLTAL